MIPGEPVPLERHRSRIAYNRGKAFVQHYESRWMQDIKLYIQKCAMRDIRAQQARVPLEGPLHLTLYFAMPRPKSRPRSRPLPDSVPDFDNLTKLVLDALNGLVWRDDAQITDCAVKKRYDYVPRTEVAVRPLTAAEAA